ncbi:hypothetical protein [Pseudonocardia sp. TRM90224]|uniref:hypothetical protein n=1 Tax=Pseudonocardia sp. TRM90224 TaxID=2812678 RepID=UPI001E3A635E|nr:hypothetical protein [Pseudonocardia sp. TRM90224]
MQDRSARTEALAAAVLSHPGVVRLDGGPFGTVASYLPGRRLVGVRVGEGAEPVELALVAALGTPLQRLADELGAIVRGLLGPVRVEVTVTDVAPRVEPVATASGHGVMGGPQP